MLRGLLAAIAALGATILVSAHEGQPSSPPFDSAQGGRELVERPPLNVVVAKANDYVAAYQKGLRGIVAEETYYQNFTTSRGSPGTRARTTREGRQLKSDVLMVKLGEEERWVQFRDVFEVDRRPVRDRDQRLYKLFVNAGADARKQVEEIQAESSRYNIGPVMRTINIPMLAMYFFDRTFAFGVQYQLANPGNVKRLADLAPAESISLVEFKETTKETAVRGEKGRDIPSHGKAWIDHTTGRILQTEMITQDTSLTAQISVTYKSEPGLSMLVPEEMREIYSVVRTDTRIDGRARYGKFRQFTVTTTEKPKS
jgi:hypothetical protein